MKLQVGFLLLFITACATQPIDTNIAKPVPPSRVIDPSAMSGNDSDCSITVKRDSGFSGAGCSIRIFLNAKPIADLKTEEKTRFFAPPGNHVLSAKPTGICGGGMAELTITATSKGSLIFRVGSSQSMDTTLMPTAF